MHERAADNTRQMSKSNPASGGNAAFCAFEASMTSMLKWLSVKSGINDKFRYGVRRNALTNRMLVRRPSRRTFSARHSLVTILRLALDDKEAHHDVRGFVFDFQEHHNFHGDARQLASSTRRSLSPDLMPYRSPRPGRKRPITIRPTLNEDDIP